MNRSEQLARLRKLKVQRCKENFWAFCKTISPDFYDDERPHLKLLCDTLQAFYEDRIIRNPEDKEWRIVPFPIFGVEVCDLLFIEMPPRFGKTRTITLWCAWILGKDNGFKFMYTSYNDDAAADTSRFVRQCIDQDKTDIGSFIYSDIFNASLQVDNKAINKWALKGQYFNFIAAGKGGSVTGKGCNALIVDDPVKNAEEALNDNESEKTWNWYRDTLMSRVEEKGKILINHTRWPRKDLIQRLLDKYEKDTRKPYYELIMKAWDGEKILCPALMSMSTYLEKERLLGDEVFQANYTQNVSDQKGRMYHKFLIQHKALDEESVGYVAAYCDYADAGTDYMALIIGAVVAGEEHSMFFVKDVLYTQTGVDEYIDEFVTMLIDYHVDFLRVESNNGGKGFAQNVEEKLYKRGGEAEVVAEYNTSNKETRIRTGANLVQSIMVYPPDWKERWPEFSEHVIQFQRVGKNKFDDGPDVLTMAAEDLEYGGVMIYG